MGCLPEICCGCCGGDEHVKADGPLLKMNKTDRKCTDIFILLLYIASWAGIFFIISYTLEEGADPRRLIRGYDLNNNICGIDEGVIGDTVAVWPWISSDILFDDDANYNQLLNLRICLPNCNSTTTSDKLLLNYQSNKFLFFCFPDLNDPSLSTLKQDILKVTSLNDEAEQFTEMMTDLAISWPIFWVALILSVGLSFGYIILCRFFAKWIIWSSLLLIVGGAFVLAYFLNTFSTLQNAETDVEKAVVRAMRYVSYFVFIAGELFLVIILLSKDKIKIAIEVVNETSKAAYDMLWMFSVPLFMFTLGIAYFVLWIFISLFIFSVQETGATHEIPAGLQIPLNQTSYIEYDWNSSMRGAFAFHVFHLLWTLQFIVYSGYFILVGALADWYFTPITENGKELPNYPVVNSFFRFCRYHVGTVAFASLLVAIIEALQAAMVYVEEKVIDKGSSVQLCVFRFLLCILKFIECCIDNLNRLGLIFCSITGEPLCSSGKTATQIALRNLDKVVYLEIVGVFLTTLGKYSVALGTTGICAWILSTAKQYEDMRSLLLSCVIVFLIAYLVSTILMLVFETCVDAISFCFMVDLDQNKGGNMFAAPALAALVDKYSALSKEAAKEDFRYRALKGIDDEAEVYGPSVPASPRELNSVQVDVENPEK